MAGRATAPAGVMAVSAAMFGRGMASVPGSRVMASLVMARRGALRMVLVMGAAAVPFVVSGVRAAITWLEFQLR